MSTQHKPKKMPRNRHPDLPSLTTDKVQKSGKRVHVGRTLRLALLCLCCGCTPLGEYISNGFEVGPDYKRPPAPVATHWIDAHDERVSSDATDDSAWWTVFNDPVLNGLIQTAYEQNLTVREAGFRVLRSRARLGIAIGEFFPQTQVMEGSYQREGVSLGVANRFATPERWFSQWNYGFGLAWELDFWGRFRRAIEASESVLDASVEHYDAAIVTLVGDVATSYVQIRTIQEQIALAEQSLKLQKQSLEIATAKYEGGETTEVDVYQGQSDVSSTEALIEQLQIDLRQATNQLCILMGMPPTDLSEMLGEGPIPTAPEQVVVGIPADLIHRRPDVRRAERLTAAQSEEIGIAETDFYPQISLNGTLGWSAEHVGDALDREAFLGSIGPSFQWAILNYGRIANNVRVQDARFQELIANYQNTVLNAGVEVENGLVSFLRSKNQAEDAARAVRAETAAFHEAFAQYKGGLTDYNRVVVIQERLVTRQQSLADAQGAIAQGLIQVYRSLGGGWQIRLQSEAEFMMPIETAVPAVPPAPAPVDDDVTGDELPSLEEPGLVVIPQSE
ncbi:Outer membrane protein OprM precursor [Symmachiella dynata]|uniref:Outer membrane protein OprM n=1 Tax=Symmachiella dynata TaxID=2527995 RepID=A0A517ZY72_9PLAN|nr:efflux transporter outer membrane subunit [Symmachiella dynata]QDU47405.1 Outer membrane protein OprM precursor [Symmachiella dynata]